MKRALAESMKSANRNLAAVEPKDQPGIVIINDLLNNELIKFEPLMADDRQRQEFYPVGLKNIGNSKLQVLTNFIYSMLLQLFNLVILLHS